jgi:hypothetical protein
VFVIFSGKSSSNWHVKVSMNLSRISIPSAPIEIDHYPGQLPRSGASLASAPTRLRMALLRPASQRARRLARRLPWAVRRSRSVCQVAAHRRLLQALALSLFNAPATLMKLPQAFSCEHLFLCGLLKRLCNNFYHTYDLAWHLPWLPMYPDTP